MNQRIAPALAAGIILAASASWAAFDPASTHDGDNLAAFVSAHVERTDAPPFSFNYDGKPSSSFIGKWVVTSKTESAGTKTLKTVVYSDPATGLRLTAVFTTFRDFPAVEWVIRFKNEGPAATPIIDDVLITDVRFEGWPEGPATLFRARGSDAVRADFGPIEDALAAGADVAFKTRGGRPSDAALPYFNIAGAGRGVMAAIGWTGRWKAAVRRPESRVVGLQTGMESTHFRLHPGEDVRSASMALLFWKGDDRLDGHNLFRRFVLAHHTPRRNGKPVEPPVSSGISFGGPPPCELYNCATEGSLLAYMDRLSQFGIEPDAYWIDAGWWESKVSFWWDGVGTWKPDPKRFPRGLKPIGDAARSRGKDFVLWFEPERAYKGTELDREHPEWLVSLPDNPDRIFNLGDPKALNWMIDRVSGLLIDSGVTIYRQDFNVNLLPYWKTMDAPDRIGIAEMKHIEGLYTFWDALLARVPGLLIDNCAGGGRRLDLEMVSRSIPLWRTDASPCEPNGEQGHAYGIQLYLPISGTGNCDPRPYAFRSAATGGAVVVSWEIDGASFPTSLAREAIAEFRSLRPYFLKDYYPLTKYSTEDDVWAAFQWDRPEEGDGIVMAFRRPLAVESSATLALRRLDPAADYEVDFSDYGLVVVKSGKELMSGLAVKIPQPSGSLLIKYRRLR